MENLTLAFSFVLDPDHKVVEIDHIDCEIRPTLHYLGRPVFDVLTGSKNSDASGFSGSASIEGSVPCLYAAQYAEESFRVNIFTSDTPSDVHRSGKVTNMKRLAMHLKRLATGSYVCCALRPVSPNCSDRSLVSRKSSRTLILECVLECFGSRNFFMAPDGSDIVLAMPYTDARDIDMLSELLKDRVRSVLAYDPDIRWGAARSDENDDPYLVIQKAESALALALDTQLPYHASWVA